MTGPASRRTVLKGAACLGTTAFLPSAAGMAQGASRVAVVHTRHGFALERNGRPYVIKGACAASRLERLAAAGGNSIRTYRASEAGPILDQAEALGLTVVFGLWLAHPRHGFDYGDRAAVERQLAAIARDVESWRDHPALLIWGIGNEVETKVADATPVWQAVNEAARLVRSLDPNHPTMAVVAEIGGGKLAALDRHAPDFDILGVNSYGGLASLPERLARDGWRRPVIVSEHGAIGQWEVPLTPWNAPVEPTSTEKAARLRQAWTRVAAEGAGRVLGGYAFVWGAKQEATATWHGLLLPGGETLGMVDVLTETWTGRPPARRAPLLRPPEFAAPGPVLRPGEERQAQASAEDPDNDPLDYRWEVMGESGDRQDGGDPEAVPPSFPEALATSGGPVAVVRAPRQPGPYRLFVTVRDGQGGAATGNIPFLVVE